MKKIVIRLIHLYKSIPFASHKMCRYNPTCSEYMEECINEYSLLKGLWMGFKRILRCNPWGRCGYDPVPLKEDKK